MENPIEVYLNEGINLNEASESEKTKDHEIGFQRSYAQPDGYEDDHKGIPPLQLKERCESDNRSSSHWDTYVEINEIHGEKASPQSEEVKKESEDPTDTLSDNFSDYLDKTVKIPGNAIKHEIDVPDDKLRPDEPAEIKLRHISNN